MGFELRAPGFGNGGEIPRKYTCSGGDQSPELGWSEAPEGAKSMALIVDDPDAPTGTWTHWLIWNIQPQDGRIAEGVPRKSLLDSGATQGVNDFNRIGYGGPCPPPGRPHRYFFRLYALDAVLSIRPGAGRGEVEQALAGHVMAQAEWMGMFKR